jgi:hypothetical protein
MMKKQSDLVYYGKYILGSILLSFLLFLFGVFLNKFQGMKPMSLFGVALNYTVIPKYFIGLLQWALVLALFAKDHPLHRIIHAATPFIFVLIVFDVVAMIMIKRQVGVELGLPLHGFFYASIRLFTDTYAMIIGVLIHKFYRNKITNDR